MVSNPMQGLRRGAFTSWAKGVERVRNTVGLFLGPLVALVLYILPMPSLTPQAHKLSAVMGWVVVWWITEPVPLPVTALTGAVLCIVGRVAQIQTVCAPFADPIVFLFLGSFMLAEAMTVHGLDRRFAFEILSLPGVHNLGFLLVTFGAIAAGLSAWLSNTAVTAMLFPIGLGIMGGLFKVLRETAERVQEPELLQYGSWLMLMTAYASSVGGIATPVGTPPNLIGIALLERSEGVRIPFFKWMLFALPISLVMLITLSLLFYFFNRLHSCPFKAGQTFLQGRDEYRGRWKRGEKNVLTAFLITVCLWVFPGFLALVGGTDTSLYRVYMERLPEAAAALIGASLLFILPLDWKKREFTLNWKQVAGIDWGTLLLFGGGLSMGNLMFETGLAEAFGSQIFSLSHASSLWSLTLVAILLAKVVTEFTSNTAAATMVVPVVISLARAAEVNPVPPALGAALSSGLAFIFPVSTPPNAIVYGSGMIPITRMVKVGMVVDLLSVGIIWVGLRLLLPLMDLT